MTRTTRPAPLISLLVCLALAPSMTRAQTAAAPAGVLSLSAEASADVPQDTVRISLFAEEQRADPAALSARLNQRASQALQSARGARGVAVSSGAFTVYPSTDRDGHLTAWRGRAEVLLTSHDFAAAAKLAGHLAPALQVGDVSFSLSREARQAALTRLAAQAIEAFRQRAQAAAQSFGYAGYTVRDVSLGDNGAPRPVLMAAARMPQPKAAPLALEGGDATVTVTVSGAVQMTR